MKGTAGRSSVSCRPGPCVQLEIFGVVRSGFLSGEPAGCARGFETLQNESRTRARSISRAASYLRSFVAWRLDRIRGSRMRWVAVMFLWPCSAVSVSSSRFHLEPKCRAVNTNAIPLLRDKATAGAHRFAAPMSRPPVGCSARFCDAQGCVGFVQLPPFLLEN